MEESKFNLWRACFSFCFVDGFLSPAEQQWIQSKLETLPFSAAQKQTLMSDLKNAPDIDQLLPLIDKPADRGFLVNNMRILAKLDQDVSPNEKLKIDKILNNVMSRIDTKNLIQETEKIQSKQTYIEKVLHSLMNNK